MLRRTSCLLAGLLALSPAIAQNVQVSPGGGSYATLKAAFDAINAGTHTGAITIDIVGDTTETATAELVASGSSAASYSSVLIRPQGGATRTIAGTSAVDAPLILLQGADQVSFDGLNADGNALVLRNEQAAGNNTAVLLFREGASDNQVNRVRFEGASPGATVSISTDTRVGGDGNDRISFQQNHFTAVAGSTPRRAVRCLGTSSSATAHNQDLVWRNNQFSDWFSATTSSAALSLEAGCSGLTIDGNRFFQTAPRIGTSDTTHRVIELLQSGSVGADNANISNNVIGFAAADEIGTYALSGTLRFQAIYLGGQDSGLGNIVHGNRIQSIQLTGSTVGNASTSPFVAVLVAAAPARVSSNIIGSTSTHGSLAMLFNTTSQVECFAIGVVNRSDTQILDNTIAGLSSENSGAASPSNYGLTGISVQPLGFSRHIVSGNAIGSDLDGSLHGASNQQRNFVHGITIAAGEATVSNNIVRGLRAAGGTSTTNLASVVGIGTSAPTAVVIEDNEVRQLRNTHLSHDTDVIGIYSGANAGSLVSRNDVRQLEIASSNGGALAAGIVVAGNELGVFNNQVILGLDRDGALLSSDIGLAGIQDFTTNVRIEHNSVLIRGSTSAGTRSTAAVRLENAGSSRVMRNNTFANTRSNIGGNLHFAVLLAPASALHSGVLADHNNYFVTGTGTAIGQSGATTLLTLAAWQAATDMDANSVSLDPQHLSVDDLHLSPSSPLRDLAPAGYGNGFDMDQQTRPGGNGSRDIGADEVDGGTMAAVDLAALELVDPSGPGVKRASTNFTPVARFGNVGTALQSNIGVALRIRDSGNVLVYEQFANIARLDPGASIRVGFANANLPAGEYSVSASVNFAGDAQGGNDERTSSLRVMAPLAGIYTVGSGGDFASLTRNAGAFHALATVGASADIELRIISDIGDETGERRLTQLGAGIDVLIRPFGAARTLSGQGRDALIAIEDSDNLVIDGSTTLGTTADQIGGDASLRQLTLRNDSPMFGATLWVNAASNGTANLRLRNLIIEGQNSRRQQYGVLLSGGVMGGGGRNDGIRIENNSVRGAAFGIRVVGGNGNARSLNNEILNNQVGDGNDYSIGRVGIFAANHHALMVRGNRIAGVSLPLPISAIGIGIGQGVVDVSTTGSGNVIDALVERNEVSAVRSTTSATGILMAGDTGNRVINNMVRGISAAGASGNLTAGIYLVATSTGSSEILHNSVGLSGTRGAAPSASFALAINGPGPGVVLRNNILANSQTNDAGGGETFAIGIGNSALLSVLDSDYNLFHAAGSPSAALARSGGLASGTSHGSLLDWQTLTVDDDQHALVAAPAFSSDSDLHLSGASPAIANATVLAAVGNDFDGDTRPGSARDIGADEFQANPVLALNPAGVAFGTIALNNHADASLTLSNTGNAVLTISAMDAVLAPFSTLPGGTCGAAPFTIAAGAQCSLTLRFSPSAAVTSTQTIAISHDGSGASQFELSGTGMDAPAQLQLSQSTIAFGAVRRGSVSDPTVITVSNLGSALLQVSSYDPPNAPFVRVGGSCAATSFNLAGGASCTLSYRFEAAGPRGSYQSSIGYESNGGSGQIDFSGSVSAGALALSASEIDFGTIPAQSVSNEVELTLHNSGDAELNITGLNGLVAPFERGGGGSCPLALPLNLAANTGCSITLRFVPLAAGNYAATLAPAHDGDDAPQVNLSGEASFVDVVLADGFEGGATTQAKQHFTVEDFAPVLDAQPTWIGTRSDGAQLFGRQIDGDYQYTWLVPIRADAWMHQPWLPLRSDPQ